MSCTYKIDSLGVANLPMCELLLNHGSSLVKYCIADITSN